MWVRVGSSLRLNDFVFGNLGGGSPIARIATSLAEQSAEMTQKFAKTAIHIWQFCQKINQHSV